MVDDGELEVFEREIRRRLELRFGDESDEALRRLVLRLRRGSREKVRASSTARARAVAAQRGICPACMAPFAVERRPSPHMADGAVLCAPCARDRRVSCQPEPAARGGVVDAGNQLANHTRLALR